MLGTIPRAARLRVAPSHGQLPRFCRDERSQSLGHRPGPLRPAPPLASAPGRGQLHRRHGVGALAETGMKESQFSDPRGGWHMEHGVARRG